MPLIAATLVAASLIAPEAQAVLDQGRWGLVTGDLSQASVAAARTCEGPSIAFAFGAAEVQIIAREGDGPPAAPPEIYLAARLTEAEPHQQIELFSGVTDETPARVYLHDPSVRSLMRLMEDGDGDALYVLCE